MKVLSVFAISMFAVVLTACSTTQAQLGPDAKEVYFNQNLGFSVKGYSYDQSSLPCDIDQELVTQLVDKAATQNIRLVPTSDPQQIKSANHLLALDINKLVVGNAEKNYVGAQAKEPQVGVEAAYVNAKGGSGYESTSESCVAFTNVKGLDNSASGESACQGLRRCSKRIASDVAVWLDKQL